MLWGITDMRRASAWSEAKGVVITQVAMRSGPTGLRGAAHHVLNAQGNPDVRKTLSPVLKVLWHFEPELSVPAAADRAMVELRKRSRSSQRRT